ncbi:MAG: carbohydrate-binding family 9-like protein [Verrucomicrobiota bacterium]
MQSKIFIGIGGLAVIGILMAAECRSQVADQDPAKKPDAEIKKDAVPSRTVLYKADFETGNPSGWQGNTGKLSITDPGNTPDGKGHALQIYGRDKNIGLSRGNLNIPVSGQTKVKFDWRADSQEPLRYTAFALQVKGYTKPLWLYGADKNNAISNPERGKWHHCDLPVSEFESLDKLKKVESGDIVTTISIHQVQNANADHCFMIANVEFYDSVAGGKSDPGSWSDAPVKKKQAADLNHGPETLPLTTITAATAAPNLDGVLNDPCWKHAAEICMAANRRGEKLTEQTRFLLAYDQSNLYVGVEAEQSYLDPVFNLLGSVKPTVTQRDGPVYCDDSAEIFLMPTADFYYQFVINSAGVVYDAKNISSAWNSNLKTATAVENESRKWTGEMAIPLSDLGISSALAGQSWRANFYRNNPAKKESGAWSPTEAGFHTLKAFGFLHFRPEAPVIRCGNFEVKAGKAQAELQLFSKKALKISGTDEAGKDGASTLPPANGASGKYNLKANSDGLGQLVIATENTNEIFRTPQMLIKIKTAEMQAAISCPESDLELFLNGKPLAAGKGEIKCNVYFEEENNVLGLKISGSGKPATGQFSFSGVSFGLDEWLINAKPSTNWNTRYAVGQDWTVYDGRAVNGTVFLQHTFINGHTLFAPQLENNTMYAANGAPLRVGIRISSPLAEPLPGYTFHLQFPSGMKLPVYSPSGRLYDRYQHELDRIAGKDGCEYAFKFSQPIPRLKHNWGFNTITLVLSPEFPENCEGQSQKGVGWLSGRGLHEIPREFNLKILPKLRGIQPRRILISTWTAGRNRCFTTSEIEVMFTTFKQAGFNLLGFELIQGEKLPPETAYTEMAGIVKKAKEYDFQTVFAFYGNHDPFNSDIIARHPETKLVNNTFKHEAWRKPMCPLAFMASPDVKARITKMAGMHDHVLYDMEAGIKSACLCEKCREKFARENGLAGTPDENEIISRYKQQLIAHQIKINYELFNFLRDTARAANPKVKCDIYSAHAVDSTPEKYGMDWSLYSNLVDCAEAGYDQSPEVLKQTRQALGGRSIHAGLILNTALFEYQYADQNIKAHLFKQLVHSGYGGVLIWSWEELNGIGLTAVADFTRGISTFENYLNDKNEIPVNDMISGVTAENARIFKDGAAYLYLAINPGISPKTVGIGMPEGFLPQSCVNFYTGEKYGGKSSFSATIPPQDVLLIEAK